MEKFRLFEWEYNNTKKICVKKKLSRLSGSPRVSKSGNTQTDLFRPCLRAGFRLYRIFLIFGNYLCKNAKLFNNLVIYSTHTSFRL